MEDKSRVRSIPQPIGEDPTVSGLRLIPSCVFPEPSGIYAD